MIVGCWVSFTVTLKLQFAVLPEASLTLQLTAVTPLGKLDPDGGLQDGAELPGQLSLTVGAGYVTVAAHWLGSVDRVTLAGQVIVGG